MSFLRLFSLIVNLSLESNETYRNTQLSRLLTVSSLTSTRLERLYLFVRRRAVNLHCISHCLLIFTACYITPFYVAMTIVPITVLPCACFNADMYLLCMSASTKFGLILTIVYRFRVLLIGNKTEIHHGVIYNVCSKICALEWEFLWWITPEGYQSGT